MKTNEVLTLIDNQKFLDKIYGFSYRRCNTSFEAEDLCSEIILTILSAVQRQDKIENFYAFVWTIAHRVYADFCEKQQKNLHMIHDDDFLSLASNENIYNITNPIEDLIEEIDMSEHLKKIFSEISFLSKMYRDVMILYYIDELKLKDIAIKLNLTETTVKQRLFSARKTVRKEVLTMSNRNLSLKPIKLAYVGTGNPCGNDPRVRAERMLSQNLIYLCKEKPKTAKELSDELCIPMPYIEEELEIQCNGYNGTYGMLRKLDNGKYTINILLVDYEEYDQANTIYQKHLPEFCSILKTTLEQNQEKILSIPYLSPQTDLRFILWTLISRIVWNFENEINDIIATKYFSHIIPVERPFSCVAVAFTDEQKPIFGFYGNDGICATSVGGYESVFISNIYGKLVDAHFHCDHNIAQDPKLLMMLKSIGGLSVTSLSESEKEIVAKSIECGYVRNVKNKIEPNIIVIEKKHQIEFFNLSDFNKSLKPLTEVIAKDLALFMKKHIPEHLINEYQIYTSLIAGIRILSDAIDECIKEGLLLEPTNRLGAEGMLMVVEK